MRCDDVIREKAEQHAKEYPTFRIDRFLNEVAQYPPSYRGLLANYTTSKVNRILKHKRHKLPENW